MNIRLDIVINDIIGQSGRAIIEAIIAGERDAEKLAGLANYRIKKARKKLPFPLKGTGEMICCSSLNLA